MHQRTASAMLVCAASIALPCFAQNQVEFNTTTTTTSLPGGRDLYSIDVNNDGKPDLIRTTGLPNVLKVLLSNEMELSDPATPTSSRTRARSPSLLATSMAMERRTSSSNSQVSRNWLSSRAMATAPSKL